jgi:DNA-binding NarL/FixJ family response regulator
VHGDRVAFSVARRERAAGDVSIGVLIVDDHRFARSGIRHELNEDDFAIVGEAASGAEALLAAERSRPDVVLLDLKLPDRPSGEVCAAILERNPSTSVIVLAPYVDEESVRATIGAGARGYLLKDAEDLDLRATIRRVLAGESVIDPRATAALLAAREVPEPPKLSERELNVLRLVAEGFTNPEIGARLYLSRHTVKEYLSHAMRKLDVTNRMEAVVKAGQFGLLEGTPVRNGPAAPARELIYNDANDPVRASDLKITPIKIAGLQETQDS